MPELPEVETIVNDLRPMLLGSRFLAISGTHENSIAGALDNASAINGERVKDVTRRGKFINLFFENDYVMTLHLKMSGRLLFKPYDEPTLKFERTRINFDSGSLRFVDVRKFGRIWICKLSEYEMVTGLGRLGIEPFSEEFTFYKFRSFLIRRRGIVKRWLLDQSFIAGIGNIYADEACFYARIRPFRRVDSLKEPELEQLFEGVMRALKQGVRNRGTSISDFADAFGRSGKNQEVLYVYGRGGEDCLKCGTILKKIKLVQRGTVYCPKCQK